MTMLCQNTNCARIIANQAKQIAQRELEILQLKSKLYDLYLPVLDCIEPQLVRQIIN